MKELLLATTNKGKRAEVEKILKGLPLRFLTLEDFPGLSAAVEDQADFKGNALKKGRHFARLTGKPVLADDSGLVVPALGGEPGVRSARYAGEEASDEKNRLKLAHEIRKISPNSRSAFFVCVVAFVSPSGQEESFEGVCHGEVLENPRGKGGFGYDPLFYLPSLGKTFAEVSTEEKNLISHRGKALRSFRQHLQGEISKRPEE